jgi:formyl-CoA transferase
MMGNPAWVSNPPFADTEGRLANRNELDELLGAWTREHDRDELAHQLQRADLKAAPVLDPADLLGDPHLKARASFRRSIAMWSGASRTPVWECDSRRPR